MTEQSRALIIHASRQLELGHMPVSAMGGDEVKVRVAVGGICGSDLHYYLHGGFGTVRLKGPMVLGHELAGTILEVGDKVGSLAPGQRVAVNPSLPCGKCENCLSGLRNHCTDMRFFGSAMRWPHVDGGFRDVLVCKASQAVAIPDRMSFGEAALAEPFAVCLHAVAQAGWLSGKRVLITGAGPIGVLSIAAARLAGAADITVTDVLAAPLAAAAGLGADRTIDITETPSGVADEVRGRGKFDVQFEAAGSASALLAGIAALKPRGICVLIGQGAEVPLKISSLVSGEIQLRGSFRFDEEFAMAVSHLSEGAVETQRIISATLPVDAARTAFELAADKSRSIKVQLAFD